jgi:hypothetical protein
MIAQIKEPKQQSDPPALVRARRLVATTLLRRRRYESGENAGRVPSWRIWLLAAPLLAIIAACLGRWLRLW